MPQLESEKIAPRSQKSNEARQHAAHSDSLHVHPEGSACKAVSEETRAILQGKPQASSGESLPELEDQGYPSIGTYRMPQWVPDAGHGASWIAVCPAGFQSCFRLIFHLN